MQYIELMLICMLFNFSKDVAVVVKEERETVSTKVSAEL